jgi:hypothetical protein
MFDLELENEVLMQNDDDFETEPEEGIPDDEGLGDDDSDDDKEYYGGEEEEEGVV